MFFVYADYTTATNSFPSSSSSFSPSSSVTTNSPPRARIIPRVLVGVAGVGISLVIVMCLVISFIPVYKALSVLWRRQQRTVKTPEAHQTPPTVPPRPKEHKFHITENTAYHARSSQSLLRGSMDSLPLSSEGSLSEATSTGEKAHSDAPAIPHRIITDSYEYVIPNRL